ncbi:MAG: cation diffusion facilitator family transporter [Candidatus Pacebacteria bacterium]|nr:cation diffusion facilitator family transporter [Candidatus Paceibacterota bacterium]MDD5721906.1 cation diffusion facilitator family transporter [Candidatus Paceibacterota bacterium]
MKEKIALVSIISNIFLASAKISIGLFSNLTAVLAEGIHSLMDIFSSAIGFIGIKISKRPEDEKHPYGYYKFEVLAGMVITLILLVTGIGIIYEAVQSFVNPSIIKIPILAFGIMIISALVNEIMARLKIHFGKKENSIALLSDGVHSRIDVYASLVVFIGLFLTKYWIYTDSILAFLIGIYVIKESFSLGKEAADSLLDVSADPEIETRINEIAKKQNILIDSLKTQKKGSVITASLEINLPSNLKVQEATEISDNLRKELMKEIKNLTYVMIQIQSHELETGYYKPMIGRGYGWQRRGRFKSKIEEATGLGPGGYCVCPECGYKIPHQRGKPCSIFKCPDCEKSLERK